MYKTMSEVTVKERIMEYIESQKISVNSFERTVGLSVGYLRQLRKEPSREKIKSIIIAYPELNEHWLLTGEGEMLNSDAVISSKGESDERVSYLVPLINIDSVGGVHSHNQLTAGEQYLVARIPFPDAREGDYAIMQSGDSMSPTIPPGSIIQIRKVEDWRDYIGYGNVYVLWLKDERRITKIIRRCDEDPRNFVLCCSYNPDHDDEELPRSFIREVWKVINILVPNGW